MHGMNQKNSFRARALLEPAGCLILDSDHRYIVYIVIN